MKRTASRCKGNQKNRLSRRVTIEDLVDLLSRLLREELEVGASFKELEAKALAKANEVVRIYLQRHLCACSHRFQREVTLGGHVYRRHQPGTVTYHSLVGALRVSRYSYRRAGVRNGPTVVPLEHAAGIMHGATPALAYSVTLGYGQATLREYERTMQSAHRRVPSRSTLERLGKSLGDCLDADVHDLEPIVRGCEKIPEAAHAIVIGLDRTATPMAETIENAERPRKHAHPGARRRPLPVEVKYRMSYVGTTAIADDKGAGLVVRRYGATVEDGPENILERMVQDVLAIRATRPELPLIVIQDGAPELWNRVRETLHAHGIRKFESLIDRFHVDERLAAVLEIIEPDEERRKRRFAKYRGQIDNRDGAMNRISARIWKVILKRPRNTQLFAHHNYLASYSGAGYMHYARFRRCGYPTGSGITEGACKSLITMRAKRGGARWRNEGLRAVLAIRSFLHSERLDGIWQLFQRNYSLPIES